MVVAGGGVSGVCLSVCLSVCVFVFSHDISKTDAARIAKLDFKKFDDESMKIIYFWNQKVKSQGHETRGTKTVPAWVFALLLVLASTGFAAGAYIQSAT